MELFGRDYDTDNDPAEALATGPPTWRYVDRTHLPRPPGIAGDLDRSLYGTCGRVRALRTGCPQGLIRSISRDLRTVTPCARKRGVRISCEDQANMPRY